ncbi:hypothetical protein RhiirC2_804821 [Rhizophagus irregularis]|uniref:Uncharacterized protein n=1 Tax=Rhizophagus irregularis TaxID=588596 RepID=A0A2N1KWI9_9GLOM|nr:hypothetical protein RhiirC2_804821 [Rhizophagus irregularis]
MLFSHKRLIDSTGKELNANSASKRKKSLFTRQYFEKCLNSKGEEVQVCKILDDNGSRCDQAYRNAGFSTGNLIAHLHDIHHIINENEESENTSKKLKKVCFKI